MSDKKELLDAFHKGTRIIGADELQEVRTIQGAHVIELADKDKGWYQGMTAEDDANLVRLSREAAEMAPIQEEGK